MLRRIRQAELHHVSYFGVDPAHRFLYPIFGLETPKDLLHLCPPCHDREHDRTGQYKAAIRDIDRLNFRRIDPRREVSYERMLGDFFARPLGEPFYPVQFDPRESAASPGPAPSGRRDARKSSIPTAHRPSTAYLIELNR
jgi:hypothetical protein